MTGMRTPSKPLPVIRPGGFTLLELMATITVAAVILMLAGPSLNDFMRKQRVITAVDSITSAIGQARSIAIATNSYVTIAPVDGTNWNSGVRVFSEGQSPNGTYSATADKLLGQYDAMPATMTVAFKSTANIASSTSSQTSLTYSPVGYTVTTPGKVAQVNATFIVKFVDGKPPSRGVIINALGRARTCDPAVDSTCVATATQ